MKQFICVLMLLFAAASGTKAQEKSMNLICKMDNGNDYQIKVDLTENSMQKYPLGKMKIEISENKITWETRFEGQLMSALNIDRFSLKISMFSALLETKKDSGWRYGKCEVATKQF